MPIYTYDKYGDGTFTIGLDAYSNRSVNLLCEVQSRFGKISSCRARDILYLPKDDSFHIFLPNFIHAEPIEIYTGIGKGTPFILVHVHHLSEMAKMIPRIVSKDEKTTCLVSVVHTNLFRTLYAAAGVFYSLYKNEASVEFTALLLNGDSRGNRFISLLSRIFSQVTYIQSIKAPVLFSDLIIGT